MLVNGSFPPAPAHASNEESGLDPADWESLKALAHRMLDDQFTALETIRTQPVWRPMPDDVRAAWHEALPRGETDPATV